jgi:hypothetical protein
MQMIVTVASVVHILGSNADLHQQQSEHDYKCRIMQKFESI